MNLLGCTPAVLLIVHPSGTETVIQSCQEEKIGDWVEVTDLYDDKKRKRKRKKERRKTSFIEAGTKGKQFTSLPANGLTVSAIRSSFDINRVPDWHEKKNSRKRERRKFHMQNNHHSELDASNIVASSQFKHACGYKSGLRMR